ncbi:MAG: DUF2249 domain-containing protein [Bacteroidia bacterium]|nr:DUF2249 domain-containing protein [Bacteroidia bacterium]
MKIKSTTKISEIIKENALSIDAIASINSHFLKLKNPILRKILASRVTISDAAKIGGVSVQRIFEVLTDIGFLVEGEYSHQDETPPLISNSTILNEIDMNNIFELDVRKMISSGEDPFNVIINTLKELPSHRTLKLLNSFEPIPLINILTRKGYAYYTIKESENLFVTYFRNISNKSKLSDISVLDRSENSSFEKLVQEFEGRIECIDVRELEMPAPMLTILSKLEILGHSQALLVHHRKVPQFLFPELQEREFDWDIKQYDENNVKLLIYKRNDKSGSE